MNVFRGNLPSGQVRGPSFSTTFLVKNFSITNKSSSLVIINIFVVSGNTEFLISAMDTELKPKECYIDGDIVVLANENLLVKSTGNIDYYFSIV